MYLFFYFFPKNSEAVIAQLQELKACERPWHGMALRDMKNYSFRLVNIPHRKNS